MSIQIGGAISQVARAKYIYINTTKDHMNDIQGAKVIWPLPS